MKKMHAWIILSVILNVWCQENLFQEYESGVYNEQTASSRGSSNTSRSSRETVDEVTESENGQPSSSCKWKEPPENARFFKMCSTGECEVTPGSFSQNGTRRITRCNPQYSLTKGFETDVCLNGAWSSSRHECVQCGKSPRIFDGLESPALIIGGEISFQADFPWMAGVFTPRMDGQWTLICGGTLISPTTVLTAAHCLSFNGTKRNPEDIKVGLGRLSANLSINEPGSVVSSAKEVLLHDMFVGGDRLFDLDIGLIVLRERVPTSALIMPACIDWSGSRKPEHDEVGVLAGWGLEDRDGYRSENLKWTYQKYIGYQECHNMMKGTDQKFQSPDKFCADQVKGGETEQGDSGGGLTFVRDEVHYVYGVVSTKMIMRAKTLRLYTNLMDETNHAWLTEEWRRLKAQQQQVPECHWFTDFVYSDVPTAADGGPALNETRSMTESQFDSGEFATFRRGEFPHLGIIGDEGFKKRRYGSLISEQWFLSTASCSSPDTCNMKVKLGITDGSTRASKWTPEYDVIEAHIHPDHEDDDLHNIALFKLSTVVKFSQFIRPACVVKEYQSAGTKGVTIGKLIDTLVKTTVDILPKSMCRGITSDFEDESMFCAYTHMRAKGFNMYAGFPMVGPMRSPHCMYGLLGIGAFGTSMKKPKGYMRLSYYVPWIESVISQKSSRRGIDVRVLPELLVHGPQ